MRARASRSRFQPRWNSTRSSTPIISSITEIALFRHPACLLYPPSPSSSSTFSSLPAVPTGPLFFRQNFCLPFFRNGKKVSPAGRNYGGAYSTGSRNSLAAGLLNAKNVNGQRVIRLERRIYEPRWFAGGCKFEIE